MPKPLKYNLGEDKIESFSREIPALTTILHISSTPSIDHMSRIPPRHVIVSALVNPSAKKTHFLRPFHSDVSLLYSNLTPLKTVEIVIILHLHRFKIFFFGISFYIYIHIYHAQDPFDLHLSVRHLMRYVSSYSRFSTTHVFSFLIFLSFLFFGYRRRTTMLQTSSMVSIILSSGKVTLWA